MKHKVLIVDDDTDTRTLAGQILAGPSLQVLTAAEGQAALELIGRERPALVFLDIRMPGLSGLDVLKRMKVKGCAPVVWMLTGVEDLDTAMHALQLGAAGYLTKPFKAEQIKGIAADVVGDISGDNTCARPSDKPWRVIKK